MKESQFKTMFFTTMTFRRQAMYRHVYVDQLLHQNCLLGAISEALTNGFIFLLRFLLFVQAVLCSSVKSND